MPATEIPTPSYTGTSLPSATWTALPTSTPKPTHTPTQTPTLQPSDTPSPTLTPSITYTLAVGEIIQVSMGGFTVGLPAGCDFMIDGQQINIKDQTGLIVVSIYGTYDFYPVNAAEDTAEEFLAAVFRKGNGEYQTENQQEIRTEEGAEGYSFDLSGKMFDNPVLGKAFYLLNDDNQFIFGLGMANLHESDSLWHDEGRQIFNALLQSVVFIPPSEAVQAYACLISEDETYGYTMENPIRVGGDAFDGPPRERAFLDNLLGKNGELVTYERLGSIGFEDTILDIFEITVGTSKVTLYIDEYSYSEPRAPVGFTCEATFPLSAP
jgi:hypothetical protein